MRKKVANYLLIVVFIWLVINQSTAQVTLNIISVPSNTPPNDALFLAGNFNNWNPGDSAYILTDNGNGTYGFEFTPPIGNMLFKFTRGTWASVEGGPQGQEINNRSLNYTGQPVTIEVKILSWKDILVGSGTAADNVSVLKNDFYIPQLNRVRRVWIYLPPDYDSSNKDYPVLYMHDGQNLFDERTSFAGEWGVDESLNALFDAGDRGIIVVGIDNGGGNRINEYSPWVHPQYGGGQGDAYVRFIIETLKPHIDANFRTKPGRAYTGIMGSSMGGLISLYALIEYQDVFSRAGVFSPSLWFSQKAFEHVAAKGKEKDVRIYLMGGHQEGGNMVKNIEDMAATLQSAGFRDDEIKVVSHGDGQHSEWYWRREFPAAYEWLFAEGTVGLPSIEKYSSVTAFPNPVSDKLFFEASKTLILKDQPYQILNAYGQQVKAGILENADSGLTLSGLPGGIYYLVISVTNGLKYVSKIIKL